jgi:hypothetical protein
LIEPPRALPAPGCLSYDLLLNARQLMAV